MTDKNRAIKACDKLCDKYSEEQLQLIASILFQRTIEFKKKSKWTSAEDDLLSTFFYLSSKEELCEVFQCSMESLYLRARTLGVVSPSFDTLNSYDLGAVLELFQDGKPQEYILELLGIAHITTPIKSLSFADYSNISNKLSSNDDSQMTLFN